MITLSQGCDQLVQACTSSLEVLVGWDKLNGGSSGWDKLTGGSSGWDKLVDIGVQPCHGV